MIAAALSELARALDGELHGADGVFQGVSIDSRTLGPRQLFVALRGPRFDGHAFLADAARAGAAGALVDRAQRAAMPQVRVSDTRAALGRLAAAHRARHTLPLVAVTGSNGKTTVKEMTAAILGVGLGGAVLATRGNLNNDLGVPLTLLGLGPEHRAAVVELGANHPGEIAALAELARATIAVVTNAGPAHLEGFGSVAGVARAKGEAFAALDDDGCAVVNADDEYAPLWRGLAAQRRRIEFGLSPSADYRADPASLVADGDGGVRFLLRAPDGEREVRLAAGGLHNVRNALAAAAAAAAAGARLDDVVTGLARFAGVGGRLRTLAGRGGARVIDDSYNANPASLEAALGVLGAADGRRWLVLGDMGELGPDAARLHAVAGRQARAAGVERLFALGPLAAQAADAFGAGGERFAQPEALAERVAAGLGDDVVVLVKGSRAMRLERVVAALRGDGG